MPHPHRHIIGWYRILTELRDSDVRAICAREAERRRESRKIDAARGSIEITRLHRLQKLMRLLPYYRSLPSTDRQRVSDALSIRSAHRSFDAHVSGSTLLAPTPHPTSPCARVTSHPDLAFPPPRPSYFPHNGITVHDLQEGLDFVIMPLSQTDQVGPCDIFDDPHADILSTLPFVYWNAAVQSTPATPYPLPDSIEYIPIRTLHLTSMPSSFEGPEIPQCEHGDVTPGDSPDTLDARVEYAMSKQQLQMTLDEGHIWNLLSGLSYDTPPSETESALLTLAERSTVISRSYQRRINSPTSQTYEECKELLRAMGVPCLESSGPFEAEALACAIVTHCEDTDVLVYEAPMLRGITARESPIVVVHGETVRETLALDRASYVDFALLLGTDFSQRIKNVGPNRALKFIRQHGSIERVVQLESRYPPRMPVADYLAQVGVARFVFQNLPPLPDVGLLHQAEGDSNAVSEIIQRYRLHRMLPDAWDTQSALAGNYFGDDPSVW
ncbi:hypothetical protein EV363DRAFT_1318173 [Boletus edulis]|nr:hypothetical protein EV363DRAFT_1318173 [Boletus edulis]